MSVEGRFDELWVRDSKGGESADERSRGRIGGRIRRDEGGGRSEDHRGGEEKEVVSWRWWKNGS